VKMKKPGKRRALVASWEGPYQFVGHADGKGNFDFEEGLLALHSPRCGWSTMGEVTKRPIDLLRSSGLS